MDWRLFDGKSRWKFSRTNRRKENLSSMWFLGKNKEWSAHNPLTAMSFVSDGFLLNLNFILLNLANPFSEPNSAKLLKINPLYAISQDAQVHLKGLDKDTPMIVRDDQPIQSSFPINFITEIFYMTHLSYSLSAHRLHRTLLKVTKDETMFSKRFSSLLDQRRIVENSTGVSPSE